MITRKDLFTLNSDGEVDFITRFQITENEFVQFSFKEGNILPLLETVSKDEDIEVLPSIKFPSEFRSKMKSVPIATGRKRRTLVRNIPVERERKERVLFASPTAATEEPSQILTV